MTADAGADCVAALRQAGLDADDSSLARSLYATDASLYRVPPRVVVRPRDADDVLAVLAVARESSTPVTLRGAGTSIAGNAVGPGIVIDTSRHLNRVLAVDAEGRTARVQPGVVHAALQAEAVGHGLRFGPDPSTHTRCTVGGMIGNNACGSRALGYGRTADNVERLKVALADGSTVVLGPGETMTHPGLVAAERLVDERLALVRTEFGRFGRQVSGYSLEHLLPEHGRRHDRFLVGTEGTLAVVLEATVRLVEDAPFRALAVLGFPDMVAAAEAVPDLVSPGAGFGLAALEGLDHRITDLVPGAPELPTGGGWLFAEVTGATEAEARAGAERVAAAAGVPHRVVVDVVEQLALWRIREDGAGLAARSLGRPAHSGWEDAAVPPAQLGAYLRDFDALLREFGLDGVPYGHFGDGCVHVRIDFELEDADGRRRFRDFTEAGADLVAGHGGSMSGEHGDGRARSELLRRMYSPEAMALMGEVKRVLDPAGLLNPGVLVDPAPFDDALRLATPAAGPLAVLFPEVHRCTGVGRCVADPLATKGGGLGEVMCPSYMATREEKDSTRGRARVLQDVAAGHLPVTDPAVEQVLDLCLSCKGCARDCPTGVDMATYKSHTLHQRYAGKRRPRTHYTLGRLPALVRLAPPRVANRMLGSKALTAVLKRAAGIDRRRSLPGLSPRPLRKDAGGAAGGAGTPDVWVWADSFTDHFGAGIGRAAIDLLGAAGLDARVIPERACCALTWITTGQLDQARRILGDAVATLHPYVASGVPVVGLEPSCLAALRSDATELLDDPRAAAVAAGVSTLAELLADLMAARDWTPPDLDGTEVVVQPHCHQASVVGFDADLALLEAAGASVTRLGGCCGLAGNFGMERGHYETSVAIAEHTLLPAVREAGPDAVVLADGMSCRTQLADLADVRALHLAELLLSRFDPAPGSR